ncbi:phosphatase PAP2 family protein [Methylocaldum sp. RMAD-M]|jgi:undecaprenyl-diphosphatase|uniref:phosphatase PAP2 family protein n=1 Tax=Methylocaldum sp. RMAD-M TaxID=2806557 RepID=UPI000A31EAB2|nr:phosphatase PAP2 family protein [Methylocaldum sp. RMAD-M]MBP1149964.1 undecaprenyl-diphosphatase [Methylocaldum sp. RMAD-M]
MSMSQRFIVALRPLLGAAGSAVAREFRTLVLMLLTGAGIWGFIELADEVAEGQTRAVDTAILLALRNPADPTDPIGPRWVEEMFRDFTALGGVGVIVFITLGVAGYLALLRKRRTVLLLAIAVVGGLLVNTLLKLGFDRPRPDLVPHGAYVYTASFPSGHAMLATATYLTLGALLARVLPDRRTKFFVLTMAVVLCLLVGFSRVYLGVHWPSDVAAGWMIGAAWALIWWLVARWLQRERIVEETETEA